MQNWRSALPFIAVLVVGLLIGVGLAMAFGGDDGDETSTTDTTSTSSTTTSSTSSSSTSSTTSSSTTSSTTSSSTSTSTTTSTTTTEAPAAPLADTTTGDLVGVAMGSPLATAEAALTDRLGAPDDDTGWNAGCPLDGNTDLDERWVTWGDLRVRFDRAGGAEIVQGWTYGDTRPGSPVPGGPLAAEVVMPPGITWGSSVAAVGVAIGETPEISDVFQASWVYDGADKARWWVPGLDAGQPFTQASWDARDFCE